MSTSRVITDIPKGRVNFVIAMIHADGGTFELEDEDDGEVTIIATFPGAPKKVEALPSAAPEFAWMGIARAELGQAEGGRGPDNPRIVEYHATTKDGAAPDSVPWCSSFVNFCVEEAGVKGTRSKSARSWLKWGVEAPDLVPGCIVILARGTAPKGHVGFYAGRLNGRIEILSGNQRDKVSVASYDADRVIGRRVPA